MLRKSLLSMALLASTTGIAMANTMPQLYGGASVGVATNTSDNAANTTNPGFFRGYPFNVFVGYGGLVDQDIYVSGELFGTLATAEISNKNGMKTSYSYGVSVLPGMYLTESSMVYGRASLLRSRFSSVDESSSAVQFGLGVQTAMMPMVDMRLEYDFTAYNSVGGISSPRQDAATIGFVYKFE